MSDRWLLKLAAWIHDPAEKALVLLRDPSGHAGGTARQLREELLAGVDIDVALLARADRWAAAADRPQFPRTADGRFLSWAQVRFVEQPVLIHPLSGQQYSLKKLGEIRPEAIKAASLDTFRELVRHRPDGSVDARSTFLRFWRLGPVKAPPEMGALWEWLPADTRVPDHTIWEHLRLTSALAGAMDDEDGPALFALSLGPVQGFIAQARSTSDLWAGSHLLSRLSWEAMRLLAEEFGPDAILFPDLHGVALVDRWLVEIGALSHTEAKETASALFRRSDANPLFAASLPNKCVAVVPKSAAGDLGPRIQSHLRAWVRDRGREALNEILAATPKAPGDSAVAFEQIDQQLGDFPEVHWSLVSWSLAGLGDRAEPEGIERALASFGTQGGDKGFLGSLAWRLLSREIQVEGASFYAPNPGTLYPALYELAERTLAAAKSSRGFAALDQHGYRCSLCGEREWLTLDRAALSQPPGQRNETLWSTLGRPAWTRRGEHLCALCALKRLWPTLFRKEIEGFVKDDVQRYVVSTHTMALATTLERMLKKDPALDPQRRADLGRLIERYDADSVALPRALATAAIDTSYSPFIRRLPGLLDRLAELTDEEAQRHAEDARRLMAEVAGTRKAESYYSLILLDGDWMGAWVSGTAPPSLPAGKRLLITYGESWHPQVRAEVTNRGAGALEEYLRSARAVSPARHVALSRALNGFSGTLVAVGVEELYKGKLLYAGGDDVLAMVSVDDLLGVLLTLRCLYSGLAVEDAARAWLGWPSGAPLQSGGGHVLHRRRLYRTMGELASLSAGAVIAHHTAPLGAVLRELREAEGRAKRTRDAISISVWKRAGGAQRLTVPWLLNPGTRGLGLETCPLGLVLRLRDLLTLDASRRAAYYIVEWLPAIPEEADKDLVAKSIRLQVSRQLRSVGEKRRAAAFEKAAGLANDLGDFWKACKPETRHERLRGLLELAEFLARSSRALVTQEEPTADA